MKKIINFKNTILAIVVLLIVVSVAIVSSVPDEIILFEGEKLNIGKFFTVEAQVDRTLEIRNGVSENDDGYLASVKLGGIVPVKNIKVSVQQAPMLVPCGNSIGVKLYIDGLMVVGISDFKNEEGKNVSPAKQSGIKAGDLIKEVNGQVVYSAEEFLEYVNSNNGKDVTLKAERNNRTITYIISPVKDETGEFKLGIWVRNSVAGIGTMTYYNPENNTYGALGHAIADSNTGVKVPVVKGEIVNSQILSVIKGEKGHPGELKGCFVNDISIGNVDDNTDCGIYGSVADSGRFNAKPMAAASRSQVKTGKAQIMCCIDGEQVKEYDIEIQKISHKKSDTKCMVIKVTDEELLQKTGGILQGMSGSPIIQNGKLVGAVTHVLVNDPTRGYGIFIENMLKVTS